ncbi:phosphatidylinositol 4-phosphatase [Marchantia polymorpha subsp. ruderalis]|uniref:SAC domain-containing protein n=2 Tax=Marchantia polymorpha TaxID=3197 RepID=A0AAF6AKG3_MARPO|nr:hypothetical protein MARPO_0029s0078 [Marchantia polymorpha]BBM96933.1 hypothetical protein Mp_1g01680 [Marchantia polymorpha subsp. ruderalis]|eukprot:PTQ42549.1 hypothetical protein MARPO_0029s0078 [Marchantia polymorpha]
MNHSSDKVGNHVREMGVFGGDPKLCDRMRLWELPDQVIFEPTDAHTSRFLSINRESGDLEWLGQLPTSAGGHSTRPISIFGLVGVVRLLAGTYALVVTGRRCVGAYRGSPVYLITSMKFLCCNSVLKLQTPQEKRDEANFAHLLKAVEATPGLYFSYEVDLTLNAQRAHDLADQRVSQPLWKQADPRFLWNKHLLEELIENKMEPYILPVIQGSFQHFIVEVRDKPVSVVLLSRRCIRRIGTRMWRRGADLEGHVANFVETEQVLDAEGYTASYVQVRGSIPILWEQIVDLTYKPKIKTIQLDETPKVVERHFRDLQQRYGSVIALDLINQHGSEGVLSEAFGGAMQNICSDTLRYIPFDFHMICGHIHFERLSQLYDQIKDSHIEQGYYLSSSGKRLGEQKGVVRTNCVDCLDRTNVTQSLLGRISLETQLVQIGVFKPTELISQNLDFDEKYKVLWANHGDDISIQYSGTQALKGDFVRYGKRTFQGLIQDGFNALARYFYNNFTDGIRQDAMDLIVGHYTVSRSNPSPFELSGLEAIAYFPLASALIVTGATLTTLSLRQVGEDAYQFLFSVLWAGVTAGVAALVRINGRQFCSRPRLCKLF